MNSDIWFSLHIDFFGHKYYLSATFMHRVWFLLSLIREQQAMWATWVVPVMPPLNWCMMMVPSSPPSLEMMYVEVCFCVLYLCGVHLLGLKYLKENQDSLCVGRKWQFLFNKQDKKNLDIEKYNFLWLFFLAVKYVKFSWSFTLYSNAYQLITISQARTAWPEL